MVSSPVHLLRSLPLRSAGLAVAALMLSACAASDGSSGLSVERVSQAQYPPTQFVDVLHAPPTQAYTAIARLRARDPTGIATRGQLIAELESAAARLGANALIIDSATAPSDTGVQFNPAGGLQQSGGSSGAVAVTGTAVRLHSKAP